MMKRLFFDHFPLAGARYYDLSLVFTQMQIGDVLTLKAEPDNRYDEFAVALYYADHKIGFVPRDCNVQLAKLLQFGVDVFEARIQSLCPNAHPSDQLQVVLHLVK